MANTLETKTPEQLSGALRSYNDYLCDVPNGFDVLEEYLGEVERHEFCRAFKALRDIVADIYDCLRDSPQEIGLVKINKKTGEAAVQTSQHISCVKKLLYAIGRFSELESDSLNIRMDSLMNAYMTYYPNSSVELASSINVFDADRRNKFFESKHIRPVFRILERFGFAVDGAGDEAYEDAATLKIRYPQLPSVINAMKSFALPEICRASFGFDYAKFNYRVFAHPKAAKLPLADLYSFQLLPDGHKRFLARLNQVMEEETGADYGECESGWYNGTLPCQYIYQNKLRVLQNIENGCMPAIVITSGMKTEKILQKTGKYIEYFKSLPDGCRSAVRCRGCKKGDCEGRIAIAADDRKHAMCVGKGAWWVFPPKEEYIPLIVKAYKL